MTRDEQLRQQAEQFHDEHPQVWNLFVAFTLDRIQRGFVRYSADAIMHRVRWETDAGAKEGFKINNNLVTYYARRFMRMYPQYDGFFATRRQPSTARPAMRKSA